MSDENWDLETCPGFQPDMERVDIPPTVIDLDSSDGQDFSETNDTAEDQQYEAPVSSRPVDLETDSYGYKAKKSSPQRSGSPPKEDNFKLEHEVRKEDESTSRGRDHFDRRRGRSNRWASPSGMNEERRDKDGISPRGGQSRPPSRGRYEDLSSPRRHRSPKETNGRNQVATIEPGMSRDTESRRRRETWGSLANPSESRRGADTWGTLPRCPSDSPPPPPVMDSRRNRTSHSISPRGGYGRSHRNRSCSRSRSRSRSRSPYSSRRDDRKPPSGQVCRDFRAGRCRRGSQCRFLHPDSSSNNRYSSPSEYPRDRERDRIRERERDRDREREIERDRERYPTRDDRDNLYDSRGQIEYSQERQPSQGYRSNYDVPPYNSNSSRSSERCFDFSMGRCTRGASCRYMHHEVPSGHGDWGMREIDGRERDEGSRDNVGNFNDRENDISLETERDKRVKGKEVCIFFTEGRCSRGQSCRFSHEVGHQVNREDASEQSWSRKMRDDIHKVSGPQKPYSVQPQAPNLSFTSQVQVPQQPLQSFYSVNQNPVNSNQVNQNLVNPNPVTGSTAAAAAALGLGPGQHNVNSYTSLNPKGSHNISGYGLQGQTMVAPTNITQSILGAKHDQSFPPPPPPPPPVNQPNPNPSNLVTSEQAANITDIKAYLSQILANNPVGSTSVPVPVPVPEQPANNPIPHEKPTTPPVEIKLQEVKKEEVGLDQRQNLSPNPNPKPSKEAKGMKLFKCALVEVVKDLLKPSWKEGQLSREAHKAIVKKVVDKVTGTMEGGAVPQTQEKVDSYLSHSKSKLTKLVQAYVEKYIKPGNS